MNTVWGRPVVISLPRGNRAIDTTFAASLALSMDWPTAGGPASTKAVIACLAVMEGTGTPDQARIAFVAAAQEVGALLEG
ncbi:MAG TPA: DUF982 domain-containing protein [Pseudorhizobium sp.]|nr:DUF982 domain-containing protein [Pseudorhizobium sp.]